MYKWGPPTYWTRTHTRVPKINYTTHWCTAGHPTRTTSTTAPRRQWHHRNRPKRPFDWDSRSFLAASPKSPAPLDMASVFSPRTRRRSPRSASRCFATLSESETPATDAAWFAADAAVVRSARGHRCVTRAPAPATALYARARTAGTRCCCCRCWRGGCAAAAAAAEQLISVPRLSLLAAVAAAPRRTKHGRRAKRRGSGATAASKHAPSAAATATPSRHRRITRRHGANRCGRSDG
jgi:hypothetical protein